MYEIIIDGFAGGGGVSTGAFIALGRHPEIAINHDPEAIAMHMANHPGTKHYCESVWNVDPVEACAGRPVGLAWFSPDCKHFSKAKGGKPVEKKIRGLAWIVLKWAGKVKPRVIILENVEEFTTWGPIRKGRPLKSKKGQTFQQWKSQLEALGYVVEHKELTACDYGAPTSRKRFFLVARRDGKPIVWPEPTHGNPKSPEVQAGHKIPWRTAAEIIDWSMPCPSIFERKKPLAENTLRRIARGIKKFVIESENPYIVPDGAAMIARQFGQSIGHRLDEPMGTIMANGGGKSQLVMTSLAPFMTECANASAQRIFSIEEPVRTMCAGVKGGHFALVSAFLSSYYGDKTGKESETRGATLDTPAPTIVTANRHALVAAHLVKHYGGNYTGPGADLENPLPTVTTVDHNALVTSHLIKMRGTCQHGAPVSDPMPTITAGGMHIGEVRAFLMAYYGTGIGSELTDPMQTIVTKDRFGLVTVSGVDYQIVDIGMRMLSPRELYNGQSFPGDYITNHDYLGNKITGTAQVRMVGNSVPPVMAAALIAANVPELAVSEREATA